MAKPQSGGELRHRPSMVTRRMARARYIIFVAILAITGTLGWQVLKLEFNFSVDAIYVFDDPELLFYQRVVVPEFGASDNSLAILVTSDRLFSPEALGHLVSVHRSLEAMEGVAEVRSLVNARVPSEREDAIAFTPLFPEGRAPTTTSEVQEISARAARASALSGWLVSRDRTTAVVIASLDAEMATQTQRSPLVARARAAVDALGARAAGDAVTLRLTGVPAISESITDLLRHDQLRFIPGVLLVMGFLLYLAFRSLRGVALPFLATGTATIWTLGVMSLEGHSINVANNAIIVLLLVIGVSDAIHLLARFEEEVGKQRSAGITVGKLKTVAIVTQHLGLACLLTSVTTAVGFGSLVAAKLVIIKEYGLDAAIGVCLAYVATIGLIPALLAILPLPTPRRINTASRDLSDRLLSNIATFAMQHRRAVAVATILVTATCLLGTSRIRAHDRILAELPSDHPVHDTLSHASRTLGGLLPFELVLETPPGRADDPDVLLALEALQRFARQHPTAPRTLSAIDLLSAVDDTVRGSDAPATPWSREKIAQLLLLLDLDARGAQQLRPFLSTDRRLSRIACFGDDMGSDLFFALRDALYQRAGEVLPDDAVLHVTGPLAVTYSALDYVVRDMATSLGLAMLIILGVMGVLFRSLRIGILALVPNAIPVLMALAVMGFGDITLRPGTVVVFSMALGITVDNAIHFLARYREELNHRGDVAAAVEAAVRGTGRPILYTTILLSLGLCVLQGSDFVALRHLALLGSTTFITALVVDLLLLPVLLLWLKPR